MQEALDAATTLREQVYMAIEPAFDAAMLTRHDPLVRVHKLQPCIRPSLFWAICQSSACN